MTRNAKLYLLKGNDWKPLSEIINNHKDYSLIYDLTIFQFPNSSSNEQYYSILSLSEKIDNILENYGAQEASENDILRTLLHEYNGEPLLEIRKTLPF